METRKDFMVISLSLLSSSLLRSGASLYSVGRPFSPVAMDSELFVS